MASAERERESERERERDLLGTIDVIRTAIACAVLIDQYAFITIHCTYANNTDKVLEWLLLTSCELDIPSFLDAPLRSACVGVS